MSHQDKQPRRPSDPAAPLDKLHPASDMNERAKGGDKFSNPQLPPSRKEGDNRQPQTTPGKH